MTLQSKVIAKIDFSVFSPLYLFYIVSQKNKQHDFLTFFIPGPKDKMATNGKINTNPSGSSLGEQLVAKRLTLLNAYGHVP